MKTIPCIALASLLLPASLSRGAGGDVPFPSALDAAAVVEDRLDDIYRNALVLGNGDLNALLYAQGGALCMRITKNDVWDARVDTSQDPPMAVFDVAKHTWKGGSSGPASYGRPYPVPRVCANLILGDNAAEFLLAGASAISVGTANFSNPPLRWIFSKVLPPGSWNRAAPRSGRSSAQCARIDDFKP